MSQLPVDLSQVPPEKKDAEIARVGLIAELDAVNLYLQMAEVATDPKLKEMLLDIAKEEKTHIGEFQALLLERDPEQVAELAAGKKEVDEE